MNAVQRRIRWRRGFVGGAVVLVGIVGILGIMGYVYVAESPGPIGARLKAQHAGSYTVGDQTRVNKVKTFVGYTLRNHTGLSETIVKIRPTNIPAHVQVRTGWERVSTKKPLNEVASGWPKPSVLPYTLATTPHFWAPVLGMTANKPGIYKIDGLLVTYRWDQSEYRVYLPDEFELCANKSCPRQVPAPPFSWPITLKDVWHHILTTLTGRF